VTSSPSSPSLFVNCTVLLCIAHSHTILIALSLSLSLAHALVGIRQLSPSLSPLVRCLMVKGNMGDASLRKLFEDDLVQQGLATGRENRPGSRARNLGFVSSLTPHATKQGRASFCISPSSSAHRHHQQLFDKTTEAVDLENRWLSLVYPALYYYTSSEVCPIAPSIVVLSSLSLSVSLSLSPQHCLLVMSKPISNRYVDYEFHIAIRIQISTIFRC
jgi:hypothetical protein